MTPSEAIRVAPPVAASGATVVDAARIPAAEIPVAEGASCHGGAAQMKSAAAAAGKSEVLDRYATDYPKGPHDQPQSMCPAFGSLRVEVQDADGKPVPGFALADSVELYGDTVARNALWKDNPDLGALAGKPVRLRFVMKDADLYSIKFEEAK